MITHDEMKATLLSRYPTLTCGIRGFEFLVGWAPIVDSVLYILNDIRSDFKAFTIKEKLGQLRVQGGPVSPEGFALIRCAEAVSSYTCEVTGSRGRLGKHGGVLQTLAPGVQQGFVMFSDVPDYFTISGVEQRRAVVLEGDLEFIPEGYADLLDAGLASLETIGWPPKPSGQRVSVRRIFGSLTFSVSDSNPEHITVCRFLERLSTFVDPDSGELVWQ